MLVDQRDGYAFRFGLVGDVLAHLAVVPLRGLLVVLLSLIDAIGDISHVADYNRTSVPLDGHIDHRAADLVLHVAHDALMRSAQARSGRTQALVAATTL